MPYIQRNKDGKIVALTAEPIRDTDESCTLENPEVVAFLSNISSENNTLDPRAELLAQDLLQIRILEDLIDLLTSKGIIMFSELPLVAQQKILNKKNVRHQLSQGNDILVEDNAPFML